MKTKLLTFALLSSLLLSAHAQDSVYSNVVGMVKLTIQTGQFSLISIPFDVEIQDQTVEDVFGESLPTGSQVFAWDNDAQTYETTTYIPVLGGWTPANLVVNRGRGFFIKTPYDENISTRDIVISGNVPNVVSTEISVVSGFQFLGYPYPVSSKISEMVLGQDAEVGDTVFIWEQGSGWVSSTYIPVLGGWTPDLSIEPSTGFMYKSATIRSSIENQPYNLN